MQMEAIGFDFGASRSAVTLRFPGGEEVISAGCGEWVEGSLTASAPAPRRVAASGVWTAADTFLLTLRYYETPFSDTYTFQFDGDRLLLKGEVSVVFAPKEYPQVKGKMEIQS
jgi:hypothetical protein